MKLTGGYIYIFLLIFLLSCGSEKENWTHYRGSKCDGHSQSETAPVKWDQEQNVVWKTSLEGRAWSSPVVYGNQIWLSSATRDGEKMWAYCIDFKTGKIISKVDLFAQENPQRIHPTNSYATPTPCIDKERVYFHYGTFGTACVDAKSKEILWKRDDLNCEHMQGPASCPILYKDLLILHIEGTDVQLITALDKYTGKTVWEVHRPTEKYEDAKPVYRKSFETPLVITINGQDQLISNGSLFCMAYDPNTGEEIWRLFYGEDSTVAVPLFYNGTVYVNSGWIVSAGQPFYCRLYAVDPTGKGDITETHVKWMNQEHIPQTSTPIIVDGLMYSVTERGMLSCRDAKTGEIIWTEKLKGHFDVSMIFAAGHIYFGDTKGNVYVIAPGREYQLVATNDMDDTFKSTPAILRGSIILRTEKALYRIQDQ